VNIVFASAVMLFLVLASVPAHAALGLTLYDNFDAANLDPTKWVGSEEGSQGREAFRSIKSHQLRLGYIGYCDTESDNADCISSLVLNFTNPDAVNAIEAVISPLQGATVGCATNAAATSASIEILGYYFNVAVPTPGSHTGDVRARIGVERASNSTDPAGLLRVTARVVQCLDADCANGTQLGTLVDLGTIAVDPNGANATTLDMLWAPISDQFIFARDGGAPVSIAYTVADDFPPGLPNKRIHAHVDVPSCTDSTRPSALIQAFIDEVMVAP
jgi:hypothetical protein